MNDREICWLAGLLEGEGCFDIKKNKDHRYPRIQVNMNDRDVVERVATMIGANVLGPYGLHRSDNLNAQPYYQVCVQGAKAVDVMKKVRPFMLSRRAAKIDDVLAQSTI